MRNWLLTLGAIGALTGLVYDAPAPASAQSAGPVRITSETIREAIGAGAPAGEALARASVLRRSLMLEPTDRAAAAELTGLYDAGLLRLEADDARVESTLAALGSDFRRTETKRFVLLSDASPEWTRERERLLERTYHEVRKFARRAGLAFRPPEHKLVVVLFAEHASYQAFAREHDGVESGWVAGYYATVPNHAVFYDDRTSPVFQAAHAQLDAFAGEAGSSGAVASTHPTTEARRDAAIHEHVRAERLRLDEEARLTSVAKATHEAAHLIAFNTGIQLRTREYPFWITEGLATAFETHDPSASFGPGTDAARSSHRVEIFAEVAEAGGWSDAGGFVGAVEAPGSDAEGVREAYARAHALFADVVRHDPEAFAAILDDIARGPVGRRGSDELARLFVEHIGDPEEREAAVVRRLR